MNYEILFGNALTFMIEQGLSWDEIFNYLGITNPEYKQELLEKFEYEERNEY